MAAHRYWRVNCTASSDGVFAVAEFQLRTSAGGSNVIGGGTASASNSYTTYVPSQAIDGLLSTYWTSYPNTAPQWWMYDFGVSNPQDIVEITITSRPDTNFGEAGTALQLQYSDNNSTWTTLLSWSSITWSLLSQSTLVFNASGVSALPWRDLTLKLPQSRVWLFPNSYRAIGLGLSQSTTVTISSMVCRGLGSSPGDINLAFGIFSGPPSAKPITTCFII